ncbi:hypothetical protein B841_09180 [Corynebacterium maris DSM 45190]|uniref:Transmembrane protein n=1 Tax=Corynebacterium maris DSM 45190 TaxID=1224163 RepID=S5SVR0_9CORY|nr:hypothetical protein [Corynebacterium maris]AGS35309.1 hypothetical protein B841_09180 [Corynebacterium maris DSM 45190]
MTHHDRHLRDQIAATWGDHTHQSPGATSASAAERLKKYRPTALKKTASWISVGFAAIALLTSFTDGGYTGGDMVRYLLGSVLLVAMLALPGAYWLLRNNSDQLTVQGWVEREKSREQLAHMLVGRERDLLGQPDPPPLLPKRRWGMVIAVMFVLMILGGTALPTA